jgi:hypothetical protein
MRCRSGGCGPLHRIAPECELITTRQMIRPYLIDDSCTLHATARPADYWCLQLNFYLNAAQTPLKVPKHFMSAIRSLINSMSKLCRVDERAAKGTFPTLSLEPFDGLLDLFATFRACNFQRQIVEKHSLVHRMNKISSFSKYRSCEDA